MRHHLESKIQFQRELDDSAITGSENLSKRRRFPPDVRWTEIRMIESVEHLRPELKIMTLVDIHILRNRDIEFRWAALRPKVPRILRHTIDADINTRPNGACG